MRDFKKIRQKGLVVSRRLFTRIDRMMERVFDRLSPGDLRVKYIIALLATAAALSAGQILIQFSLSEQLAELQRIRLTDRLALEIDSLARLNDKIPLEATKEQVFADLERYDRLLAKIDGMYAELFAKWPHAFLSTNLQTEAFAGLEDSRGLLQSLKTLNQTLTFDSLARLQTSTQLQTAIHPSLREADVLLSRLSVLIDKINAKLGGSLVQRMNGLQSWAFMIVLLILTILFLQGMYVFRPSIQKLYRAVESRSDLLSRLGHEIRNPLNAVIGISNILLKRNLGIEENSLLKRQKLASENLLSLLNNLLKTAESDSGEVSLSTRPTTLNLLLDEVVEVYSQVAAEKELEFYFSYDGSLPATVVCDDVKLKEVLMNLLGNAIKFTSAGSVALSVEKVAESRGLVTLEFAVTDSGIGISKHNINRIFERFVQENESIKRRYGGSGLGLSICQIFLSLMDSQLQVDSTKGKGSVFRFTVTFPGRGEALAEEVSRQLAGVEKLYFVGVDNIERKHIQTQVDHLSVDYDFVGSFPEQPPSSAVFFIGDEAAAGRLPSGNIFYLTNIAGRQPGKERRAADGKICVRPFKVWDVPKLLAEAEPSPAADWKLERALNVLVVDDVFDNQVILTDIVQELGGRARAVSGAEEAFRFLAGNSADVVFMDIQMPDIDGYMALAEIQRRGWNVPVIAVTAHETEVEKNKIKQAGFSGHIVKPVSIEEIHRCLKAYGKELSPEPSMKLQEKIEAMIPSYLKRRTEDLKKMEGALTAMQLTEVAEISHRIRGSAKTFGFDDLDLLARQLETEAVSGNSRQVRILLGSFREAVENYKSRMSEEAGR